MKPGEQVLKMGTFDPFGAADKLRDRALLHLAQEPKAGEETWEVTNPRLGETFYFRISKDKRFVVLGTVTTSYITRTVSRRQVVNDVTEIVLPRMQFDIAPGDKALYVGTFRTNHATG